MFEKLVSANPTIATVITMFVIAVSAFFLDKIHAGTACRRRRKEEREIDNQRYLDMMKAHGDRILDLQQRLKEVESDRDEYKNMTLRLAGVLEEVPSILRRK